ncbi:MAG: putative toxin-antitoxin system toxin component, PIN family [Muribaculaceae bacterium]|nr:putative toxin-antitoxin system toxin component, PIN family [Muribaculaceae bacterium]
MNATLYAVIDTNVIVSAILSKNNDSPTVKILYKIFDKSLIPVFNEEILQEYSEVLHRPKFKLNPEVVDNLISALTDLGLHTNRATYDCPMPDPDDRVFYEVALGADAYLVTGNIKHFPRSCKVLTPGEMLYIIEGE